MVFHASRLRNQHTSLRPPYTHIHTYPSRALRRGCSRPYTSQALASLHQRPSGEAGLGLAGLWPGTGDAVPPEHTANSTSSSSNSNNNNHNNQMSVHTKKEGREKRALCGVPSGSRPCFEYSISPSPLPAPSSCVRCVPRAGGRAGPATFRRTQGSTARNPTACNKGRRQQKRGVEGRTG